MGAENKGAASAAPRSRFTITADEDGSGSSNPITVEVRTLRPGNGSVAYLVERAEVDVDYDSENDEVVVTVRRIEDDPTVRVVLV